MQNKRIFISGGAGVIGTALVESLLDRGADLFVGDLKPCPKDWLGKVKYRQGDLNTIRAQELLDFDPEIFFHLAATFERSEESFPFWSENFHHNVKLSHHLMDCLKTSSALKQVVFASSYLIYDPMLYQFKEPPPHVVTLKEDAPIYPRNICGAAKFFHEQELRFLDHFLSEQTSFACARIFRVYGRHSRDVISRWVRAALQHEALSVYRPEGCFDYIFADDVAEGLIQLAQKNFSGIVNLGSGHARSIHEVLDILKIHFPKLKIKEVETDIPIEASQADMQLFKKVTGWTPPHRLETAIPKLIQFEKENLERSIEHSSAMLITSISKKVPLLQAVRQAVDKLGQLTSIHGCDSDENCIAQYSVDAFWHCPPLNRLTVDDVLFYCQQHYIKAIIPTRNADLEFYAKHLKDFQRHGIKVMVSDPKTILNCLDKKRFADLLIEHRYPAIPTEISLQKIKAQSYVVKERYGAGSIQMALNVNKEEALSHAKRVREPIFQPYIEGIEWSIDVYRCFLQDKVMGCVARQRNMVVKGESQVTTTVAFPALEKLCHDLAQFLNIRGHAVFQVIEDKEGDFHIIECNPRFGGASTASLAVGLESFYWFLLECLGQSLQDYPFIRSKTEVRQVRYAADWILPWS